MDEEDSQILKLIRDPVFPKVTYLVVALAQLIIFTTSNFYGTPSLSIVVSILTLLTSIAVIVILAAKKSEAFANCCFFKSIVGKPELGWNSVYFTYTIAFACLNLMTIPSTLYKGRYAIAAILGLILMAVYLVEAYKANTQIVWHRWENINEDPRKYIRFLKFVGRFPVLTNLLIAFLTAGLVVVICLGLTIGSHGYWNYYYLSYSHYSYYYMTWDKFTTFFAIGFLLAFSLMNIMTMKFKCIQSKLDKNNIQRYKIKYTLTLVMAVIAFVGFIVSFGSMGQFPIIIPVIMAALFVLSLFMALSEAHAKCDEPNSDDRNSILPKSLSKSILNPVVSNELKVGLDGDTPKI